MRRAERSGVVSLEFAIGAIVLFMLIQMVIETGWQVATEFALEQGARAALRFAVTGSSTVAGTVGAPGCRAATIVWLATAGAPGMLRANNLQVTSSIGSGLPTGSGAAGFGGSASQTVLYTFVYRQPYVTPAARGVFSGTSYVHTVTIAAENEPYPNQPC